MYLISPDKKQYKANLHCHSTLSDGKKTPEELKEMYKRNGYSVLCISDHEYPKKHTDLAEDDFILITGYESYIRPVHKFDAYNSEIHINFLAKDPDNTAMVCYDERYIKYAPREVFEKIDRVGEENARVYSTEYINYMLRVAKENGMIATYNHPLWSMEDEATVLAYDGFCSMEMCNYSSFVDNRAEYNAGLYDKLLCAGKRIACHSADDNHNRSEAGAQGCDSFGGFAMIIPDSFEYGAIVDAIEMGNMYSSMGPIIKEVSIEENKVHIECSPAKHIAAFTGSKTPKRAFAPNDGFITCADFELDDRAKFLRVSITDEAGRHADTRGFFRDELPF